MIYDEDTSRDESQGEKMSDKFGRYTAHAVACFFPLIDDEELQALADDIKARGQQRPCVVDGDTLIDGRNRWRACELAGVEPLVEERAFTDDGERARWIISENVHRRHLTPSSKGLVAARCDDYFRQLAAESRREGISRAMRGNDNASNEKQIPAHGRESVQVTENKRLREKESAHMVAQAFETSPRVVERARAVLREGDDAVVRAVERGEVTMRAAEDIVRLPREAQRVAVAHHDVAVAVATQIRRHKGDEEAVKKISRALSRIGDKLPTLDDEQVEAEIKRISLPPPPRANNSGEDEWYTPQEYVEAAREVMQGIDVDPASNQIAQEWVRATTYYTAQRSGLGDDVRWAGRVWMNPPYSRGLMDPFCRKLIEQWIAGYVTEAIVLTHNNSDTEWWHSLCRVSSALCLTRGRIAFVSPQGGKASPTQGQTFFYVGDRAARFASVFSRIGAVLSRYDVGNGDG